MSYRLTDPQPVFFNLLGTESAAGGSLQFYDYQTTTPKATYSDRELTTENPNPVPLNAAGRPSVQIWLDGEYTVQLKDEDDTDIGGALDVVPEVSPTTVLPDPTTLPGGTVKSNGVGYELDLDIALPDPTDSAGQMVVVNGTGDGYGLQPIPEPEEPDIEITATKFVYGGGGDLKAMVLIGTGTAPATGTFKTSLPIEFPTPFKSGTVPYVSIIPFNTQADGGPMVGYADGAPTASGFTAAFDVAEGDSASANVGTPVSFAWRAEGVIDG